MGKKRVNELAKELGTTNRDLISDLQRLGFDVRTHSSSVDEDDVRSALQRDESAKRARSSQRRVSDNVIRRKPRGGARVIRRPAPDVEPEVRADRDERVSKAAEQPPSQPVLSHKAPQAEAPVQAAQVQANAEVPPKVEPPVSEVSEVSAGASEAANASAKPAAEVIASKPSDTQLSDAESGVDAAVDAAAGVEAKASDPAPQNTKAPVAQAALTEATAQASPDASVEAKLDAAPDAAPETVESEAPTREAAKASPESEPETAAPSDDSESTGDSDRDADQDSDQDSDGDSSRSSDRDSDDDDDEDDDTPKRSSNSSRKKRASRDARPTQHRWSDSDYDEEDDKPTVDDFGISEEDFSRQSEEDKAVRVAPPPPSLDPAPEKKVEKTGRVVRRIDPSVLKKRLQASSRPPPPPSWGKTQGESQPRVIELEVQQDASGKGRRLVNIQDRNEAGRKKTGRTGEGRRQAMSNLAQLNSRTQRVVYPKIFRNTGRNTGRKKSSGRSVQMPPVAKSTIIIGDTITVNDLSQQMRIKASEIIHFLMRNKVMAGINQPISHDLALMICEEFEYEVDARILVEEELMKGENLDETVIKAETDEDAVLRAPVVTVMGHVDHGKTSLLDRIRSTNVASGEAGGITQSIASYQVKTSQGLITFLDTPGHAAFTAMRARGANITDIVVLVVAADDGVMPQTREAIDHAQAADVPIIVALNKIDKPTANADRVLKQLADLNLLVEEWGGPVPCQRISAKTGDGIRDLLELIAIQSELLELKANPKVSAIATVVEGHVHKGKGPVATVLVRQGTLRQGDVVVVGENLGRVRAMISDQGKRLKEAGPSVPVELLGLDGVPHPGEEVRVAISLDAAKELADHRREKRKSAELQPQGKITLSDLYKRIQAGGQEELKLIIKADVQGSVEALTDALHNLSTSKVKVNVIRGGVGAVTESDVELAKASEAIIIGFAVRPDTNALKAARAHEVEIKVQDIIYEIVDEVKNAMAGLLPPIEKERYLGRAEVRQTFSVPKVGTVAGCAVVDGNISRNANVRLLRDGRQVYDGKLSSLKRFKDDVREVREGFECGMGIERFNDIREGDTIEAYEIVMQQASLADVQDAQPKS